jgi:hypothetical protein
MNQEEREDARRAERTRDLKLNVINGVGCEGNENAALEAVPKWACSDGLCELPTYRSLARAINENHSNLWICLTVDGGQKRHRLRAKLEDHLELSRGGMWDVLSVVERLR